MTFAMRILRFFHPTTERERMEMREALARAQAEAEDLTRTIHDNSDGLKRCFNNGLIEKK